MQLLTEASPHGAYMGFVFVVLQILNSSAGKTQDAAGLLKSLRILDPRFPETLVKGSSKGVVVPVPELGEDFLGLMARMTKEKFVLAAKDSEGKDAGDEKNHYTLGPRFHAEV